MAEASDSGSSVVVGSSSVQESESENAYRWSRIEKWVESNSEEFSKATKRAVLKENIRQKTSCTLYHCWSFKTIKKNIWTAVDHKTLDLRGKKGVCNCWETSPLGKCLEGVCWNRSMHFECSKSCGQSCANQRIQNAGTRSSFPNLQLFHTEEKGLGVRIKGSVGKGDFIIEFLGEVIPQSMYRKNMQGYAQEGHSNHYCFHLDDELVIDAHRMGNLARFVNHSCDPNCTMEKWYVNGIPRVALFALRNVAPNEELTYDYMFYPFHKDQLDVFWKGCQCGTRECRNTLSGRSSFKLNWYRLKHSSLASEAIGNASASSLKEGQGKGRNGRSKVPYPNTRGCTRSQEVKTREDETFRPPRGRFRPRKT